MSPLRIGNYTCKLLKRMSKSPCYITDNEKYFIKKSYKLKFNENEKNILDNIGMYGHTRIDKYTPVIPIYETFQYKFYDYIVYPYIKGHDLQQLQDFNPKIWLQILFCIKYLHNHNIAHCDIKPENFMYYKNNTYVCDFEFSKKFKYNMNILPINSRFGTMAYISPEIYQRRFVSLASDIYSLGKMYYIMRTSDYNFNLEDNDILYNDEKEFIREMTKYNVDDRPNIIDCIDNFKRILC